jgi:hypothetical protein
MKLWPKKFGIGLLPVGGPPFFQMSLILPVLTMLGVLALPVFTMLTVLALPVLQP